MLKHAVYPLKPLLVLLPIILVCQGRMTAAAGPPAASIPARKPVEAQPNPRIKIVIEKRGTLVAELNQKKAPKTTAHIVALVKRKFYDRLLFHSVVKGFMAITGDPKSRSIDGSKIVGLSDSQVQEKYKLGSGKSGSTVPLEPGLSHVRGTLGIKRSDRSIDSGDCMFFINLDDNYTNDNAYTVFGTIVDGMDILDRIKQGDRITSITLLPKQTPAYLGPPHPTRK